MRRIKTYVVAVGVALSVAPIFSSALAQQESNSTQLLLQVQSMRQEIAELRDMVERQQFQFKQLKKQTDAQIKQLELAQSYGEVSPNDNFQATFPDPLPQDGSAQVTQPGNRVLSASTDPVPLSNISPAPLANTASAFQTGTATASQTSTATAAQIGTAATPQLGSSTALQANPALSQTQLNTNTRQVNAQVQPPANVAQNNANVGVSQAQSGVSNLPVAANPNSAQLPIRQPQPSPSTGTRPSYPPVIDRSFSTTAPAVQVTGAGSQLPVTNSAQGVGRTQNSVNNSEVVYSAAAIANSAAQNGGVAQNTNTQPIQLPQGSAINPANGGAVSVPPQTNTQLGVGQQAVVQIPATQITAQQVVAAQPVPTQIFPGQVAAGQGAPTQTAAGQLIAGQNAPLQNAAGQINAGQAIPSQVASAQVAPGQASPPQAVPAQTGVAQAQAQAPTQAALSEDDYYSQGFDLLKQSQYEDAAAVFEQQLQVYPRGELADDAHYWIAEAMHVSRKLDVAKAHLKAIISDYPQSRRLPDAMLKTAYIEQSQGNQIEARILFQEIVNLHPQSDAAIAAKNQLAAAN